MPYVESPGAFQVLRALISQASKTACIRREITGCDDLLEVLGKASAERRHDQPALVLMPT